MMLYLIAILSPTIEINRLTSPATHPNGLFTEARKKPKSSIFIALNDRRIQPVEKSSTLKTGKDFRLYAVDGTRVQWRWLLPATMRQIGSKLLHLINGIGDTPHLFYFTKHHP